MKLLEATSKSRIVSAMAVILALAGCSSLAPTGATSIPPIPAGTARVWFYREDAPYISQARPYVRMNGAIVAISEDGGAFYRDVAPGEYYVTVDSYGVDINQFPHVILVPGQTVYLQVIGSRYWASGGAGANWLRPTFYVWVMPNDVGGPAVARSPFYANAEPSAGEGRSLASN
jgi:hypothetical protein